MSEQPAAIFRRAGGRRRYNSQRQREADTRRVRLVRLLQEGATLAEIEKALNVSRWTLWRDRQKLTAVCPRCGQPYPLNTD